MEMEFRIEKRTGALLIGLALLAPATFAQQEFRYEAWHGHSRPPHIKKAGNMGALAIAESGISFAETYKDGKKRKHPHAWRWAYQDIQQLKMASKSLTVLTYKDNKWKLGADKESDEGVLRVGVDEIVYQSAKASESRTWRYQDIENVSTTGPFQLTITTFERAKTHYGNLKGFNFEMKQQLDEAHYSDLWLRLNQSKGLKILTSYREGAGAQ